MERYGGEELLALILDLLAREGRLEHEHRSLRHVGDAQSELVAREVCKPKPQLVALLHGRMLLL